MSNPEAVPARSYPDNEDIMNGWSVLKGGNDGTGDDIDRKNLLKFVGETPEPEQGMSKEPMQGGTPLRTQWEIVKDKLGVRDREEVKREENQKILDDARQRAQADLEAVRNQKILDDARQRAQADLEAARSAMNDQKDGSPSTTEEIVPQADAQSPDQSDTQPEVQGNEPDPLIDVFTKDFMNRSVSELGVISRVADQILDAKNVSNSTKQMFETMKYIAELEQWKRVKDAEQMEQTSDKEREGVFDKLKSKAKRLWGRNKNVIGKVLGAIGVGVFLAGALSSGTPAVTGSASVDQQAAAAISAEAAGGGGSNESPLKMDMNEYDDKVASVEMDVERGVKDGYDEAGMWMDGEKASAFSFGNARKVAEKLNTENKADIMEYMAGNQLETFADHLSAMPNELKPVWLQNLDLNETERALDNATPEQYKEAQGAYEKALKNMKMSEERVTGSFQNACMMKIDPNGPNTHDNFKLVSTVTNEDNTSVTRITWMSEDGRELGTSLIKLNIAEGEAPGCGQIIELCQVGVDENGPVVLLTDRLYDTDIVEDHTTPETPRDSSTNYKPGGSGSTIPYDGPEDPGDKDPGDEDPGDEDPGDEDPGDENPGDEDPGDPGDSGSTIPDDGPGDEVQPKGERTGLEDVNVDKANETPAPSAEEATGRTVVEQEGDVNSSVQPGSEVNEATNSDDVTGVDSPAEAENPAVTGTNTVYNEDSSARDETLANNPGNTAGTAAATIVETPPVNQAAEGSVNDGSQTNFSNEELANIFQNMQSSEGAEQSIESSGL